MPRYFFNVYDVSSTLDPSGTVLPDIYTAQEQAMRMAGELLREMRSIIWDGVTWKLEVVDETGEVLFVLHFSAEEKTVVTDGRPRPDQS
jgi:hypothetical protein